VKTLAKPLSKRIKHDFSRYNFTKQGLIRIGQTSHSISSRMQIWSAGYRVRTIKPLEEEKALKDGAEFVGEAFIFSVSGTLVVLEYNRSADSARRKEEAKRAEAKAERAALQAKLLTLDARLKAVESTVIQNSHSILGLGGSTYVEPAREKLVSIEDGESLDDPSLSGSNKAAKWWKIW
jgi:hypothetical protein